MKKCLIVFMVFALLLTFVFAVGATTSIEVATVDTTADTTAGEQEISESWFGQFKTWVGENFSGLTVALAAIWAVIPKVGGVSMVLKALRKIALLFAALKTYIDDANNENSLYNVMKRQGDKLSQFMNDMAPLMEKLELDKRATVKLTEELELALTRIDKMGGVLGAVEESLELMASEFSDLISISTTISHKKKAEMEAAWLAKIEHLRNTVKEATNDGQSEKADA